MHQRHDRRALAARGRHPLHRPRAHVAGREDAGDGGGEVLRRQPVQPLVAGHVAAGEHEAVLVARHRGRDPVAVRLGAEQQEQAVRRHRLPLAGADVLEAEPLEPAVAAAVDDRAAGADGDPPVVLDLADQVRRHGLGQVRSPDQDGDRPGEPRQVHRRLAGGVAAADDEDVLVLHLAGGRHRGAVVDAQADQLLDRARPGASGRRRRWRSPPSGRARRRSRCTARAGRRRSPAAARRRPGRCRSGCRTGAPGCAPAGPAACRRCRGGSRGSCGSSSWCRPGRRPPPPRAPRWRAPRTRRTRRRRDRRARLRRRRRRPPPRGRSPWGRRRC